MCVARAPPQPTCKTELRGTGTLSCLGRAQTFTNRAACRLLLRVRRDESLACRHPQSAPAAPHEGRATQGVPTQQDPCCARQGPPGGGLRPALAPPPPPPPPAARAARPAGAASRRRSTSTSGGPLPTGDAPQGTPAGAGKGDVSRNEGAGAQVEAACAGWQAAEGRSACPPGLPTPTGPCTPLTPAPHAAAPTPLGSRCARSSPLYLAPPAASRAPCCTPHSLCVSARVGTQRQMHAAPSTAASRARQSRAQQGVRSCRNCVTPSVQNVTPVRKVSPPAGVVARARDVQALQQHCTGHAEAVVAYHVHCRQLLSLQCTPGVAGRSVGRQRRPATVPGSSLFCSPMHRRAAYA